MCLVASPVGYRRPLFAACVMALAWLSPTVRSADAPATQPAAAPVFTEDFESGELKKDIWDQRVSLGATITVQHDLAAHGKNALLIHYPQGNTRAYGFAVVSKLPESLKTHFFGRAYVQFPKAPPNAHDVFIHGGTAGFPISNFLEIGLRQNKAQLSYQQNGANITRGEKSVAGPAYPVGKWFCLEWEFNDDPDAIVMWIDGEKVTDAKFNFNNVSAKLVKEFNECGFGFRSWGNVPAGFDVYYDDIAFGTERVGPVK